MNEDSRQRLNAALDMIRQVYQCVDESLSCNQPGVMQTACDSLQRAGKSGRQIKKILAREMFSGVTCTSRGYSFCEQAGLEQVALMNMPMNLQA